MAEMKRFAVWLAKCIFERKMTEEAIIDAATVAWNIIDQEWTRKQIEEAKKQHIYKELSHHE